MPERLHALEELPMPVIPAASRPLDRSLSWILLLACLAAPVMGAEGTGQDGRNLPRTAATAKAVGTGAGSIFLQGKYIEVGMHTLGSFGAEDAPPVNPPFHPTQSLLGFVVDPNGWNVAGPDPATSGDFFVPGDPEEVWGVTWSYGQAGAATCFMNAGLVDIATSPAARALLDGPQAIQPSRGYPIEITGRGSERIAIWRGVASKDFLELDSVVTQELDIVQTVRFDTEDKFFVVNVVMTNVGTVDIPQLKYLRSVDPDQEAGSPVGGDSTTNNYVVYQPPGTASAAFPDGNLDKALVIGEGLLHKVPLGLGAIDRRARVSYGGFSIRDPAAVIDLAVHDNDQLADSARAGSPFAGDKAISLAFGLGTLKPGQSVSIDYAYILDAADLERALGQLALVSILQPTGTVSGSSALFQARTTNPASATVKVDFYVGGVQVGSDDTGSASGTYETTFDTTALGNGLVTIAAVATFANGDTSRKSGSVTIDNSGPPVVFDGATPAAGAQVSGSAVPVQVTGTSSGNPPVQVALFRETGGVSTPIATLTQAPFTSTFSVTDLALGTTLVLKAVATNVNGGTTTVSRVLVTPPLTEAPVTTPSVPLSQGDETIYAAVSPGTPEGELSLLAALAGNDPSITRAFAWDALVDRYVELPAQPSGGIQSYTGIFIATRRALSYSLVGTPTEAPFSLVVPSAGWTFAGIPPIETAPGVFQTTFPWGDIAVMLDNGVELDDSSTPTLAEAMGDPATPADGDTARPYFWNGSAYEQVASLVSGKAYWFKNNLSEPVTLVVGDSVATLALRAVRPSRSGSGQPTIRNQGTPPPPPSSASSSSDGGSCGSGSGIAAFALLMFLVSLRFLVARR
jgi:hypothetical protein